jgi:DNA-binding NtrC family response regulator
MKALILIIGDDPVLMRTRAELLRDWQVTTVNSREAGEALRLRPYDLVILSQTVQEAQARSLIAQAQELRPSPRILAIRSGDSQQLEFPTYQVDLNNPGGLRSAVARILEYQTTPSAR